MLLSHNTDFDYWTLSKMEYKINRKKTKENEKLEESVKYDPIGAYSIITNEEEFSISKVKTLEDMEFGYKNPSGEFDFVGARKKAYGTSQAKLLATILNKKQDLDALKGGQAVKIYKNKKK